MRTKYQVRFGDRFLGSYDWREGLALVDFALSYVYDSEVEASQAARGFRARCEEKSQPDPGSFVVIEWDRTRVS
jgi:hypothetical protein